MAGPWKFTCNFDDFFSENATFIIDSFCFFGMIVNLSFSALIVFLPSEA